ncbi:M56 family metallopeptidase [Aquiflexum sp.]|uniref:M56 family metallopeptidase n=1 Tax=Aquiflexum sp. TaxID=1872584 RepID=UPI003593C7C2
MILFLLKSTLSLVLLLALYHVVLSKESTFRFNRFYLLFALVFSFLVPFISIPKVIPTVQDNSVKIWNNFESAQSIVVTSTLTAIEEPKSSTLEYGVAKDPVPSPDYWKMTIAIIYVGGFLFFTLRFGFQLGGFWKLIKENSQILTSTHTIVLMKGESLPFTFLNYLFVSKSTYKNSGIENEIIAHEMAHIRQKHSWDILAVEVLRCIFWFNPILLLYRKAIQLNHEFLADEAVNTTFRDITAYQWLLYSKVQNFNPNFPLCSPFNYSVTAKRLKIMGSKTDPLKSALLKSLSFVLFVGIIFALSPIKNSLAISIPFMDSGPEEYETIIAAAFDENQAYMLNLTKLNLKALQKAYEGLSEEERGEVTEFPFFEEAAFSRLLALQKIPDKVQVAMQYNNPPPTMQIKIEIWENWRKTKNVELEIDGEMQDISVLDSYTPKDFVLHEVRETSPKKFLKKPSYIVKLTTPEEYHRKYIIPKKEIKIIVAQFEDGDRAEAYYFMKNMFKFGHPINSDIEPFVPENFEASVLDAFLNFSPSSYRQSDIILKVDLEKDIPISIVINGERKSVFVPIVENGSKKSDNRSKATVIGWSDLNPKTKFE